MSGERWKVAIVGGSLAGLASALELSRVTTADITVFEQTAGRLEGRGAGIVMQPEIEALLSISHIPPATVSVPLVERQLLHRHSPPRVFAQPQTMTAWDTLYRTFRGALRDVDYRQGVEVTTVTASDHSTTLTFADGTTSDWDMVIGADGIGSTVRQFVQPEDPRYSGYVAWRGLERESDLPPGLTRELTDRFTLFSADGVQFLCYLVPGPAGEIEPGLRRVNWVWYVNASPEAFGDIMTGQSGRRYAYFLPADEVSAASAATLHALAKTELPPLFAELIDHSAPFLQPVMDLPSSRLRRGPAFVIGDAAGTVRPHTASGTSKSIGDAAFLAQALSTHMARDPLPESALRQWENHRLRVLQDIAAVGVTRAVVSRLGTTDSAPIWDRAIR